MGLTHVDASGNARMVDVSQKRVTIREATASGRLRTTSKVIELLRQNGLPKGDALAVARVAGIAGAKRTPDLVPLCHPVALHAVTVELDVRDDSVEITATTRTADRTGVEMEAITAVMAAGLTLYDMVKAVDRAAQLTDIRLVHKSGGRSGEWNRRARRLRDIGGGHHVLESVSGGRKARSLRLLVARLVGGRGRRRRASGDRP